MDTRSVAEKSIHSLVVFSLHTFFTGDVFIKVKFSEHRIDSLIAAFYVLWLIHLLLCESFSTQLL